MARARNIKPGFFTNEDLVEFDFATRLLFIGLWTVADREGRLQDRPKKIKIDVFPADNLDVDAMLDTLHHGGFINRYEVNGAKYIQITNWAKHQNPHHTEKASDIPASNGELTVKAPLKPEQSPNIDGGNLADSLIPDSGFTDSLIPDSGKDVLPKPAAPNGALVLFDEFWKTYPKKVGKDAALKAFSKRKPNRALVDQMLSAIGEQSQSDAWRKENGQFIPNPATWLNEGRWQDEGVSVAAGLPNADPDSRAAVEAEGIAKGYGPWDQSGLQWHVYKAKVRGTALAMPTVRKSGFSSIGGIV